MEISDLFPGYTEIRTMKLGKQLSTSKGIRVSGFHEQYLKGNLYKRVNY